MDYISKLWLWLFITCLWDFVISYLIITLKKSQSYFCINSIRCVYVFFFICLCTFLFMFFTSHALLYVLSQSWQVFSSWSTFHLYCFSEPAKKIKFSQLSIIINMSPIAYYFTYKAWTFPDTKALISILALKLKLR